MTDIDRRAAFVVDDVRLARNAAAWAIGHQQKNGFVVRRVVWGRVLAKAEKRRGEEVRRALIYVKPEEPR